MNEERIGAGEGQFDLIVAGDLVYDDEITDALLTFLKDAFISQPNIQEKRQTFYKLAQLFHIRWSTSKSVNQKGPGDGDFKERYMCSKSFK